MEAQARGEKVTDVELAYAHGYLWQVRPKDTQPYLLWIHRSLCCNIIRFRVLPMLAKRHGAMWSRGRHFRVAAIDGSRVTIDNRLKWTNKEDTLVYPYQCDQVSCYIWTISNV